MSFVRLFVALGDARIESDEELGRHLRNRFTHNILDKDAKARQISVRRD
jgi:hypothetical protein